MNSLGRVLGPVAVLLLALAPAATAGEPFTIADDGRDGDVAVDDRGTAHFVWNDAYRHGVDTNQTHDITRYCQVPRNATACTKSQAWPLDGVVPSGNDDFGGPKVLLADGGDTVVVLTQRCCTSARDPLFAIGSTDRGTTFAPPRQIGTNEPSGDAMLGPGAFSVSTITAGTTGGVRYQAAPLNSVTQETANLGETGASTVDVAYDGALALIDPLRPLAAMSDLDDVYFRVGPASNWNVAANWGMIQNIGPGQDTNLAYGPLGPYLMYLTGEGNERHYVVRKFGGFGFAPPERISHLGYPAFSDFTQDPKGGLHAVWDANEAEMPELHYRLSRDGELWQPREVLTTESAAGVHGFFNTRIAAARDRGGFVVFDDNGPPLKAVQFGTTKPLDPNAPDDEDEGEECVPTLKVGAAELLAREGCFAKQKQAGLYEASGDIRMNGIDIEGPAGFVTTVDKKARTLTTGGKQVSARVGNVVLGEQPLALRLPATPGPLKDASGNPATFDTEKANQDFLGLPVSGLTMPVLAGKNRVEIPIHVGLPSPFDGLIASKVTADTTLVADNSNVYLDGIKLHVANVFLGIASVETFDLTYNDDPFQLDGESNIVLPVIASKLFTDFRLVNGEFVHGKASLTFDPPGRPITGLVYLNWIKFGVEGKTATSPTRITGGVGLTGGPTVPVFNEALVRVDGTVSYTFPSSPGVGVFRAQGAGFLAGFKTATAYAQYETSGKASAGGSFQIGPDWLNVSGSVGGIFDAPSGKFQLTGSGYLCVPIYNPFSKENWTCGGADTVMSSTGIAGCAGGSLVGLGAGYKWGDSLEFLTSCGLGSYKPLSSAAGVAQAGSYPFTVPPGQPLFGLAVTGTTGAPRVTVVGPDGSRIESPANAALGTQNATGVLFPDAAENVTYVMLRSPSAGGWRVDGLDGSPIASVARSRALPKARVRGRVRGRGARRTLAWTVRKIPGQRVTFFEEGRGIGRRLGVAKGTSGELRIRPAKLAPGGRRTITALVEQNGLPRERVKVTTYRAPRAALPGRPRFVRLARRGGAVFAWWGRARGAKRYALHYSLRTGRERTIVTRSRRARIGNVPAIDAGRVTVAGLRADNAAGRRRRARFRARPKFRIEKVNARRRGRAVITVQVPQAGALRAVARARGAVVARGAKRARRAAGVKLALRPTRVGRRLLRRAGRLRTRAVVRYRPRRAVASSQARRLVLRR